MGYEREEVGIASAIHNGCGESVEQFQDHYKICTTWPGVAGTKQD